MNPQGNAFMGGQQQPAAGGFTMNVEMGGAGGAGQQPMAQMNQLMGMMGAMQQQPGMAGGNPFLMNGMMPQGGMQPGMMSQAGMQPGMMPQQQPGMMPGMQPGFQPGMMQQPGMMGQPQTTMNPMVQQQATPSATTDAQGTQEPEKFSNIAKFMHNFEPGADQRNPKHTGRNPITINIKDITFTQVMVALGSLIAPIIGLALSTEYVPIQIVFLLNNISAAIIVLFVRSRIYCTATALLSIALAITLIVETGSPFFAAEFISKPIWWVFQMARTIK